MCVCVSVCLCVRVSAYLLICVCINKNFVHSLASRVLEIILSNIVLEQLSLLALTRLVFEENRHKN